MMVAWRTTWPLACSLLAGCASALHPVSTKAVAAGSQQGAESLYASIRKLLRDINTEPSASRREAMAVEAVTQGQLCENAFPGSAFCDYGLALALGVQAREKPSTAHDGLPIMAEHLQRAAASDPALDHAGPERVLGLLLVRAPGWPAGPGDPETGLEIARKAAAREPGYAPNWLAVAEAANATGDSKTRREAAQTAADLAEKARKAGEPDAQIWLRDAKELRHSRSARRAR